MTLSHYVSCCDHTVYCLYIREIIWNTKRIRCNLLTVHFHIHALIASCSQIRSGNLAPYHSKLCKTCKESSLLHHNTNCCSQNTQPKEETDVQTHCCKTQKSASQVQLPAASPSELFQLATNCYITGGIGCITVKYCITGLGLMFVPWLDLFCHRNFSCWTSSVVYVVTCSLKAHKLKNGAVFDTRQLKTNKHFLCSWYSLTEHDRRISVYTVMFRNTNG